jgi:hypothetical protein
MKTIENPTKSLKRGFPLQGSFYVVKGGIVEKQPFVRGDHKSTASQRLPAEEAAQQIIKKFGRSLAVLAD